MSKTKLDKRSLKIFGATSIALFSLVTVFTATIAWFALNYDVDGNGMMIAATEDSSKLNKIEIYEYVETIDKGDEDNHEYNFSFKSTPSATIHGDSSTNNQYFLMGDYNPLHTDHPILILFTLRTDFITTIPGDMYVKGLTTTPDFMGVTVNGAPKYNLGDATPTLKRGTKTITVVDEITGNEVEKEVDCYPLSSAVNFKCADYSSDAYDDLIAASTTNRIDIPTDSITLSESFVNFASSGAGITFKQDPMIYSSKGDGSAIQYVAMVVNYDGNAISAIYSTYLGNSTLDGTYGGQLYFTCDWILEVL